MTPKMGHMTPKMGRTMLKPLIGSTARERVLIFILVRGSGYAREIADFFQLGLNQVQRQLDTLESGSVLVSRTIGRTRNYEFNPRYAFLAELRKLLERALSYYPGNVQEDLTMNRRRPRRRSKPL